VSVTFEEKVVDSVAKYVAMLLKKPESTRFSFGKVIELAKHPALLSLFRFWSYSALDAYYPDNKTRINLPLLVYRREVELTFFHCSTSSKLNAHSFLRWILQWLVFLWAFW